MNTYREEISNQYRVSKGTDSVESKIEKLTATLHKAGAKAIPNYRKLKTLKTTGKAIWNTNIGNSSKRCKQLFWQWKQSGRTNINNY